MVRKYAVFAAWATFGLICFVTLSPIGLRPQTGEPRLERFVAYAILGALFMVAYPRHLVRWVIFLAIAAAGLEVMQHLTPDRHGHVPDAMEKIVGAWAGCAAVRFVQVFAERNRSRKAG
jgi:VanZ family protein